MHQILCECRADIGIDKETHIVSVLPGLVQKFRAQGELLDGDFEDAGIRPLPTEMQIGKTGNVLPSRVKKDALVVSKRRAVLVTHPVIVKKESCRVSARQAQQAAAMIRKEEKTNKKRQDNN